MLKYCNPEVDEPAPWFLQRTWFFGVSNHPADETERPAKEALPGCRHFKDFDGSTAQYDVLRLPHDAAAARIREANNQYPVQGVGAYRAEAT